MHLSKPTFPLTEPAHQRMHPKTKTSSRLPKMVRFDIFSVNPAELLKFKSQFSTLKLRKVPFSTGVDALGRRVCCPDSK